jgi:tRNA(Met) cytidine acetyltransferase
MGGVDRRTGDDRPTGELAVALHEQARAEDERRMLVCHGPRDAVESHLEAALDALSVADDAITCCSTRERPRGERIEPRRADRLLGRTREVVVIDGHDGCYPNAIGQAVGCVDGGGLLILLAPALESWPERTDPADDAFAVPPYTDADATGHFRRRLVGTLRDHRAVAIVDAATDAIEKDGLIDRAPRLSRSDDTAARAIEPVEGIPDAAIEQCRTADQAEAVGALLDLREDGQVVVVEADRGRGKSSAAGIAAACLATAGRQVTVTAPGAGRTDELFARARETLQALGTEIDDSEAHRSISTANGGSVRYVEPDDLDDAERDVVLVDEAAGLPVRRLEEALAATAVGYVTTVHGYEGAGRGFDVRFRETLADSDRPISEVHLHEPIRYAAGDPIEVWSFHALLLDARPPVDQLVDGSVREVATPETVDAVALSGDDLAADEHRLGEVFGLLVQSHYRTEPADLHRILDAPNVSVRALVHDGHVVSVALLAEEGGLDAEGRADLYEGGTIHGHLIPDMLTGQLRDEAAGEPTGHRVLRIATHAACRSCGLGSHLLEAVRERTDRDWLGVAFGATPRLLSFWDANGFETVALSTTRNESSGEHSAVLLDPLTPAGETLAERHAAWFRERIAGQLSDPIDDADPDVVRVALHAAAAEPSGHGDAPRTPQLSEREWRLVAGVAYGSGLFDTAPDAFRRLALAGLFDDLSALDAAAQRLLVAKALQARSWETVAEDLNYVSTAAARRAFADATRPLVDAYGGPVAAAERERFADGDRTDG